MPLMRYIATAVLPQCVQFAELSMIRVQQFCTGVKFSPTMLSPDPPANLNFTTFSQPPPSPHAETRNFQSVRLGHRNQITVHCRVNCRRQRDQGLSGSSLIQVAM